MIDALKHWMWVPAVLCVFACTSESDVGEVELETDDMTAEEIEESVADNPVSDPTGPDLSVTPDGDTVGPLGPEQQPKVETAADYPELEIETVEEGEGEPLERGQTAVVRYTGFLLDGTLFDGNRGKAEPFKVRNVGAGAVIKGWNLGLLGMKKGEHRRLSIPPELAYGPAARPNIPANSTLVFDVYLEDIEDK